MSSSNYRARQIPLVEYEPHFPKITEAMRRRCEERNVHVWNLARHKSSGICLACGISEIAAESRPVQWRIQHEAA